MPAYTRINFSKTDGSPSRWSRCGKLPGGGHLDRLFSDDDYTVKFLGKLAILLAKLLNYPGTYVCFFNPWDCTNPRRADSTTVTIDGLPDGYGMFVQSAKNGRQDKYLKGTSHCTSKRVSTTLYPGSCNVSRFRSPAEFAPHALWLLTDPSLDPSNCRCKYCRRKGHRAAGSSQTNLLGPARR